MLSQTAEYALRAIVTLAQSEDVGKTAQEIAGESQVPLDYLSKVLNSLARAGIVHAQRGRRGGFTLAIPASKMTVLQVVNAVDPIRRIRSCPLLLRAHASEMCPLHRKLDYAMGLVEDAFRSTTIASLREEPKGARPYAQTYATTRAMRSASRGLRAILLKMLVASTPAGLLLAGLAGSYLLPIDHEAIQYSTAPVDDVVARLQHRIDSGEVKLRPDDDFGYLRAVLGALDVPESSQVLVFSKTSFQAPRIAPRTPRALYFNDHVAIGFVRTGDVLEAASLDPKQGVMFYTLDQEPSAHPRFERRDTCLQCHQSGGTLGIPGLVVRSVFPDSTGMPLFHAGTYVTDHRSPLKERWGGWYVTGTHGPQSHMGNAVVEDRNQPDQLSSTGTQNLTDLHDKIDTGAYLTPHSDIVALMTLEHQTQMVNLIVRVGWEARLALHDNVAINKALGRPDGQISDSTTHRINSAADELVEYMLFSGETHLTAPIQGTSGFAQEFAKAGPHDPQGRSLREFDMRTRMFRYPCSYMIYSEAFDAMPAIARDRVYRRLWEVLSGKDTSAPFTHLSAADRKAILEILRATKPGLPAYWASSAAS